MQNFCFCVDDKVRLVEESKLTLLKGVTLNLEKYEVVSSHQLVGLQTPVLILSDLYFESSDGKVRYHCPKAVACACKPTPTVKKVLKEIFYKGV